MVRIILRVFFILSISFNIAFLIYLLGTPSGQRHIDLNMTDIQARAVSKIHLRLHKENEAIKKEIRECQNELINTLKRETVQREKVVKCIEKISKMQKKIQLNTIDEIIQVKNFLDNHQCDCLINGIILRLSQASKPCNRECCRPKK